MGFNDLRVVECSAQDFAHVGDEIGPLLLKRCQRLATQNAIDNFRFEYRMPSRAEAVVFDRPFRRLLFVRLLVLLPHHHLPRVAQIRCPL
jgi:hypothetical protein